MLLLGSCRSFSNVDDDHRVDVEPTTTTTLTKYNQPRKTTQTNMNLVKVYVCCFLFRLLTAVAAAVGNWQNVQHRKSRA